MDARFGEELGNEEAKDPGTRMNHPLAVVSHLSFRLLAIVVYLLCGWFSDSFVGSFVAIVILLSLDFWTVKNITGRLLVGLRWWNYVDDAGLSHWVFEARKESEQHKISPVESRVFWTTLFLFPILWVVFFFVSLFGLKFKWFVVVCIGLALNGANLYGYIKCKLGKKQTLSGAATSFFQQNVLRSVMLSNPSPPVRLPEDPIHTI